MEKLKMIALVILALFAISIFMIKQGLKGLRKAHSEPKILTRIPGQSPEPGQQSSDSEEFFWIGKDFFCDTSRSPDGRFIVGANEGFEDDRGRLHKGECALKVVSTNAVCFRVPVTRANNPHVSVDGLVIVEDWKNQALSGSLLAFNRTGERLWVKHFKANISTSGLSLDGKRAFVCTCNSDYAAHSGKTFFIDTQSGKTLWSSDEGNEARFDGVTLGVDLRMPEGNTHFFPYDARGHLSPVYYKVIESIAEDENRQNHWVILPKVQEAMKQNPPDLALARKLLSGLEDVEEKIPPLSRARLFRFRGELADVDGDTQAALLFYRMALELDPKVGVKRRDNALLARQGNEGN